LPALRTAVVVGLLLGAGIASADPAGSASGSDAGSASGSGSGSASGSASGSGAGSAVPVPLPVPLPGSTSGSGSDAPAPLPEQVIEGPHINIRGRVINVLGKGVAKATVQVEGTAIIATTDKQGFYRISGVAIGASLVIDAPTYQTALANVGGTDIDDVVMLGEEASTETIEVSGSGPPAAPGAAQLERTEMERVAGTGNDLVRTLSAMPGVVNFQLPLGYAGVVIRGSSPQDSKVLVDDFEVPTLYHDIGLRSVIPTESIEKLDYIPGGFDVSYGRAASGIVSLTTRQGADKRSDQAEVSVIDGGLIAQGPIDKDTTYMIGFRRSVIDLLLPHLIPSSVDLSLTTVPRYYDEQFRIDHRINEHWKVKLSSVGSDDALEIFGDKAQDPDKRFYNRTRFARITAGATYHDGPWTATFALSGMPDQFVFEIGTLQHIQINAVPVGARTEVTRITDALAGLKDVIFRVGAEANVTRYVIDLALPQEVREGQPMGSFNPKDTSETFHGVVWTPDFAEWTSLQASLDPRIRATVGMRVDEFARVDDFSIEPRSELSIKLTPELTGRLSSGSYVRPPEYQTELLAGNVHPERAWQNIVGLQWDPRPGIRVQPSLYYTDRTDLLTYGPDGKSLLNQGRGTTYGAELLATLRSGPWFGFISYSYSHSTRGDAPGDAVRLFDFDQPHSLNVALSWKKGKWQLGGRFQLYSGLPETPVIGSYFNSDTNVYSPIYGKVNSDRAPMHHELDIRIDRYFKWGPLNMSYFLDVQNVYLNQSVVQDIYSYDYSQKSQFTSIPIIPSVGLRGQF
jgi:outer membrane receptor protein involved in Fe transport